MKRNIALLLAATVVLVACKEDEITYFNLENDNAVCFPGAYQDARTYSGYETASQMYIMDFSFQTLPLGTEYAIVDFPVKIVGNTADFDREVGVHIIAEGTTAASDDYEIVEAIIPANEMYGRIRFKIHYKDELDNERDTLRMVLVDSKDLKRGTNEYNKGMLMWSNIIPAIPSANFNYGSYNALILSEQTKTANNLIAYSPNAHRAILDALGWPVGFWVRWNQGFDPYNYINVVDAIYSTDFYAQILKNYLDEYAAANGGVRLMHNAGSQKDRDVVARVSDAVYVP